jgi:hypothetical protein
MTAHGSDHRDVCYLPSLVLSGELGQEDIETYFDTCACHAHSVTYVNIQRDLS